MTFRHRASTQSHYSRRTNMGSPQLCHQPAPPPCVLRPTYLASDHRSRCTVEQTNRVPGGW